MITLNLRNCSRCGKVFPFRGFSYCQPCVQLEEQEYQTVKTHLKRHPRLTLDELHERTGVGRDRILRFVREGRLIAQDGIEGLVSCERCGKPIPRGSHCPVCIEALAASVERVAPRPDVMARAGGSRMHLSERIRSRRT